MPQENASAYEYLPEESVTKSQYEAISREISRTMAEDIGREHVDCDAGPCPVDFNVGDKDDVSIELEDIKERPSLTVIQGGEQ